MSKAFGVLLICIMFLASHLAEAAQCCPDGDTQESISQSSLCDGHYSDSKKTDNGSEHHDCDLSCHHCHHGFHYSAPSFVSKVTFTENIVYYFTTLQTSHFEFDLLRPPALS